MTFRGHVFSLTVALAALRHRVVTVAHKTQVAPGQSPAWQPVEVPLGDGRILVLDDS